MNYEEKLEIIYEELTPLILILKPKLLIGFGSYFKKFKKPPKDMDILIISSKFKNFSLYQRINFCKKFISSSLIIDLFPWTLNEFMECINGYFLHTVFSNKFEILYIKPELIKRLIKSVKE